MHFHLVSVTSPQPQGALNKRTFANFPLWTCRDFLNLSPVSPKVFKSFLGLGVGQKMGVRGGARSRSDSWRALPGLPTRVTFSLLSLVEHAGRLPEPKKLEATSGEPLGEVKTAIPKTLSPGTEGQLSPKPCFSVSAGGKEVAEPPEAP